MNFKILTSTILILLFSCSTAEKSSFLGASIGATIGGVVSKDKAIGSMLGGLSGAFIGEKAHGYKKKSEIKLSKFSQKRKIKKSRKITKRKLLKSKKIENSSFKYPDINSEFGLYLLDKR